ncbi:MAG TPA: ABC transporter ATP-binding protein [Giesbergeria sp.]|mgnify:FL=1|uniref:ABC transporter ATP-binding protein n=1 Tax=Simplicispira sedimenti TaxID=2919500 RepID=UPI001FAA2D7D|nr:ABC transporter ATP-binding protein [Giesbergeria sp.]HNN17670.1 ABC transporter ATP-binding protein [Giesbergeria sp.]HNN88121.1 ABC transporter ATP-binding protein [Giesbergeria sp.]
MASISPASDTAAQDAAVALRGVSKHYGALHAVDGVDLDIPRGEIFGLIGHNGAGKSTLFKMMLGLVPATQGSIIVGGAQVGGRDFRAARRHLGYLPENVVLYDNLSGLETLRFFARLKHAPQTQCQAVLERVGLQHAGQRPVREYSKGMRQRLGFAQALLGQPRVLFLDEPTNGLDPQAIRDFYATLRGLQADGVTVIITSHILAELQERVDRLAIMAAGKVQAVGSVQALREQTQMPLCFTIDLAPQDATEACRLLAQATGITPEVLPTGLRLRCPRTHKMAVLAALAPLGARVQDLKMLEPSLEDVFFGFAD